MGEVITGYNEALERGKQLATQNPFRSVNDDLTKFNRKLQDGLGVFDKLTAAPKLTKSEVDKLASSYGQMATAQQKAGKSGDWKKTEQDLAGVRKELKQVNDQLDDTPKKSVAVEGALGKIGSAIKTAFTATGILYAIGLVVDFGKKLIDVTGTSEKYQNQFTRIFEGNKDVAKGYLSSLQNIADTTNYTFDTLADNVSKLASRGIIPTKKELLGLGDVANFINKDFEQLNEAILDANNSERWKELGFTVKTEGNKMTLAYGDFSKTVDTTVAGAYEAIQGFSELGKVQGSTAEAGATLSGRMSTLEDTFAGLFRTIGQGNNGVLNSALDWINKLVVAGVELYKTLAPAFDSVGTAFSGLGKAIGGVIGTFSNFQTSTEKTATVAQQFGYYIEKFIVRPLKAITLVAAGTIEAFNLIALGAQYAAAKISGDESLESAIKKQIDASLARLADLKKQGAQLKAERDQGLGDYVKKDNARKAAEDATNKANENAAAKFKPKDSGKPKTDQPDKAAEAVANKLADERAKLLEKQKDLQDKLKELGDKAEKQKLDSLDKNSQEYIELKRKYDLEEIDDERQKYIQLGQLATGTAYYDKKRKQVMVAPNKAYTLPKESQQVFDDMKAQVNAGADVQAGRAAEDAYDKEQVRLRNKRAEGEAKFDKEVADRRRKFADQQHLADLAFDRAYFEKEQSLVRQAGESELDYEKRKNEALFQLQVDHYERMLALAKESDADEQTKLGLEKSLAAAKKGLKEAQDQQKTGPQDIFDFLGIKFSEDPKKNEERKKIVSDFASATIDGVNQVLSAQIAADQARVASIDQQLEAKQRAVDTEAQLAAAGLANNLSAKKQEYAVLKSEREKALADQRKSQTIQLALNATLQASEMALALAQTIQNSSKLPAPFGLILAATQIVGLLALFGSTISQVRALPKYHDGDEVTHETARRRSLGDRPARADEVDARLQIGEGVTRKKSYQANKRLLKFINTLERPVAFDELRQYVQANPLGMPDEMRRSDLAQFTQYNDYKASKPEPDHELYRRVDKLSEHMSTLIEDSRRFGGERRTLMPDGSTRIEDSKGNVRIVRHR
jgi:hypothetical protein